MVGKVIAAIGTATVLSPVGIALLNNSQSNEIMLYAGKMLLLPSVLLAGHVTIPVLHTTNLLGTLGFAGVQIAYYYLVVSVFSTFFHRPLKG